MLVILGYHLLHIHLADAVTNQLCALKVLSLAVGARGQNALPFVYKEYNSVSLHFIFLKCVTVCTIIMQVHST